MSRNPLKTKNNGVNGWITPISTYTHFLTPLQQKTSENIVAKEEFAHGNILLPHCFQLYSILKLYVLEILVVCCRFVVCWKALKTLHEHPSNKKPTAMLLQEFLHNIIEFFLWFRQYVLPLQQMTWKHGWEKGELP